MSIKAFVYSELKKAMSEAGHVVSEGETFLAKDFAALKDFAHFKFGLSETQVNYGLAYPEHLLSELFPGHPDGKAMPAAATIATAETTTAVDPVTDADAPNIDAIAVAEQIATAQTQTQPPVAEMKEEVVSEPDAKPAEQTQPQATDEQQPTDEAAKSESDVKEETASSEQTQGGASDEQATATEQGSTTPADQAADKPATDEAAKS